VVIGDQTPPNSFCRGTRRKNTYGSNKTPWGHVAMFSYTIKLDVLETSAIFTLYSIKAPCLALVFFEGPHELGGLDLR